MLIKSLLISFWNNEQVFYEAKYNVVIDSNHKVYSVHVGRRVKKSAQSCSQDFNDKFLEIVFKLNILILYTLKNNN